MDDDQIAGVTFNFLGGIQKFNEVMKKSMSEEETNIFRQSCFGHFLDVPEIANSSAIVNHIISRAGQYKDSSSDALFFEIGGEPRSFSKENFAEITGLRFVDDYTKCSYSEVVKDGLYETAFHKGALNKRDVVQSLVSESEEWQTEKKAKFKILYFLLNVLIPDNTNCLVIIVIMSIAF